MIEISRATPAGSGHRRANAGGIRNLVRSYGTLLGLVALVVVFSATTQVFLTFNNIINILRQVSMLAIISTGLTFCMVTGDFDLGIGSVGSLVGVVTVSLLVKGFPVPLSLLAGLGLAALFGMVNGALVTQVGISSFISTLAAGSVATGVTFLYTQGQAIYGDLPQSFAFIGRGYVGSIPTPIIVMAFVVVLGEFILTRTRMGRYMYAIGGNLNAARLSGISVRKYRLLGLLFSSLGAGIAGIILASRLGSGQPTAAAGFFLDAIAAAFLGQTIFRDGRPNILGTFVGVLIIGVMNNGLTLLRVSYYWQDISKGAIIVLAVALAALRPTKGSR
ncbi:MAG: ABC transporter permease [Firmicutes bacterium]|nr:ABC transporter permease [Bacillota bacterium]